jgi:hypothetical protein
MSGVTKPSVLEELAVQEHELKQKPVPPTAQPVLKAGSPASAQPIEGKPLPQVLAEALECFPRLRLPSLGGGRSKGDSNSPELPTKDYASHGSE